MITRKYQLDQFIVGIGNRMLEVTGTLNDTIDRTVQHQTLENINVTYQNGIRTWFTTALEKLLNEREFQINDSRKFRIDYSAVDKIVWQILFAMNQFEKHEVHRLMSEPFESQDLPEWDTQQHEASL
jgi:hypothetical protein